MRNRALAALLAVLATLGLTLATAQQAEASTGYKSTYCVSAAGDQLTVTSWINATGTKTWHWSAEAPYFNNVYQTVTSAHYYATEGYLTNARTGNYIWKAYWLHGGTYYACNLTV